MKLMKEDKKANRLGEYLVIKENSNDKELATIWKMLPQDAKEAAYNTFGDNRIFIRRDLLMQSFGYRKLSVKNAFTKDAPAWLRNGLSAIMGEAMGADVGKALRKGERGLQEFVALVKDVIVIRSGVVLAANVISNTIQLYLAGLDFSYCY